MNVAAVLFTSDDDEIRADLLALPGCERVVWGGPNREAGMLTRVGPSHDTAATWLRMLAAMTMRSSAELEFGAPRLLTISYDDRLVAVAIEPDGAILAVITREPSAVGLAMIKLRCWLLARGRNGR